MEKQKRFQKQTLNSDDHKGMEHGAKALKGVGGLAVLTAVIVKNKDSVLKFANQAVGVASKIVKR